MGLRAHGELEHSFDTCVAVAGLRYKASAADRFRVCVEGDMLWALLIGLMGTMGKSVGATGVGRIADPAASVTYETARRASAMATPTAVHLGAMTDVCLRQPSVVRTASQLVSLGGATLSNYT
jgi:hypothetical protein